MRAGFEEVFRAEYVPLVRALTMCTGNADDAADAAQDAFVQLHRHWGRVRGYDDLAGWLRGVAVRRVLNQRRGRFRQNRTARRMADERVSTAELAAIDADLWAAVRELPAQQRVAIGLYYLADLDIAGVAAAMGIAPGTVKTHLHDARLRLRTTLEVTDGT